MESCRCGGGRCRGGAFAAHGHFDARAVRWFQASAFAPPGPRTGRPQAGGGIISVLGLLRAVSPQGGQEFTEDTLDKDPLMSLWLVFGSKFHREVRSSRRKLLERKTFLSLISLWLVFGSKFHREVQESNEEASGKKGSLIS